MLVCFCFTRIKTQVNDRLYIYIYASLCWLIVSALEFNVFPSRHVHGIACRLSSYLYFIYFWIH